MTNGSRHKDLEKDIWRLVLVGLVVWLVLNRAVPDLFVLPVGIAIRPSQMVLIGIVVLLFLANIRSPRRFPSGIPALSGLLLLIAVALAPFIASGGLDEYQSDGAERGLFYFTIYTVLFIAAYQVAQRSDAGIRLVNVIVAMTVWQALLVIDEWRTGASGAVTWPVWGWFGLATDVIGRDANFRPGELFRPTGTAPHPIVMSSLLAVGILLTTILLLEAVDNRRRALLGIGIVPMVFAMVIIDTRTGFVVLFAGGLTVVALQARKLPRFLPLALAGMAALGVAVVVAPDSVRSTFNLFANAGTDNSVGLRVERLATLPELIAQNPILGPGWLTNDPNVLLWDNTYNLGLVEMGIVGVTVYVVFVVSSVVRIIGGRDRSANDEELSLLLAGTVGGVALLVGGATFDALAFDQFLPTCLLLLGIALATVDGSRRRQQRGDTGRGEGRSDAATYAPGIAASSHESRERPE